MRIRVMLAAMAACLAFSPGDAQAKISVNESKHTIASIHEHDVGVATVTEHSAPANQAISVLDSKQGLVRAKHEHQPVIARNKGDDLGMTMASSRGQLRSSSNALYFCETNNVNLASVKETAYAAYLAGGNQVIMSTQKNGHYDLSSPGTAALGKGVAYANFIAAGRLDLRAESVKITSGLGADHVLLC